MAILDVLKKKPAAAKTPAEKKPAKKAATKKTEETPVASVKTAVQGNRLANLVLVRPHVSEKAARLADRGTYVFDVTQNAEKISIRKAVESLYGVNVTDVRIIKIQGKPIQRGRRISRRRDLKKALVTLKKGQTIALYEGV
ncbi:MAG: 50S ribosomal protein L23 [Candidatus Uhrbacteria bacterium]